VCRQRVPLSVSWETELASASTPGEDRRDAAKLFVALAILVEQKIIREGYSMTASASRRS